MLVACRLGRALGAHFAGVNALPQQGIAPKALVLPVASLAMGGRHELFRRHPPSAGSAFRPVWPRLVVKI